MRALYIGDINRERVRRWVKFLISKGTEVTVLTHHPGECTGAVIVYRDWGDDEPNILLKVLKRFLYWWSEWRLVVSGGFDIVHIQYLQSGITALIATLHPRAILSIWGEGLAPEGPGKKMLRSRWTRAAVKKAAVVTIVHISLEPVLRERFDDIKRIEVIPFGADLTRFAGLKLGQNSQLNVKFCYAKPITPEFGPDLVIGALHRIAGRCRNLSVVLIGIGPDDYMEQLRRRTFEAGLGRRIHFAGRVTAAELDAHFEGSDVFLAPYRWEVLPLVVLEAMAAGMPVIAARIGGMTDAVIDGVTGLTIPPDDEVALAEAMMWLYQDRRLRERMGQNAREMAKHLYSFDLHAERMQGLYDELLSGRKSWLAA